jgi:hypothetical protein
VLSLTDPTQQIAKIYEDKVVIGLYPIVTFQYSSTTLHQVSYHIQ